MELRHRTVTTNGIRMHFVEAGEGPVVLLLHGFPESWYSWRHQIPALAQAGYRVVVPDQRGYGQTDAPAEVESYDIVHLVDDAVGLLDAIGESAAVVVGHDWGSPVAWHCALLRPERFRAVAALSVPYLPRSPVPPLEVFRQRAGDRFFYILYFQEPGVAEAELERDVRDTLLRFLYAASGDLVEPANFWDKPKGAKFLDGLPRPERLPPWLAPEDLEFYVAQFQRTGFRGGLNWYRNIDRNWHLTAGLADARVEQPALFVAGDRDGVLRFAPVEPMKVFVPHVEIVMLPGCGHWTQQERPEEVNEALLGFLRRLGKPEP
jgi:pimeloyl-ACP methyl ester carboxylesterase